MTKGMLPSAQDAPGQNPEPEPASAAPMTMAIWVHDGPVCVTVVDLPSPHVSSGVCCCPACHASCGDPAELYFGGD